MIGGFTGLPVACSTGPGRPMPMPARSLRARPTWLSSPVPSATTRSSTASGPSATSWASRRSASTLPPRSVTAMITWVAPTSTARTDAGGGVEGKARRRPAAAGAGLTGGPHQPETHQGIDPCGHGGPGQAGGESQFGPGAGLAVAEQLEKIPGTGHRAGRLGRLDGCRGRLPWFSDSTAVLACHPPETATRFQLLLDDRQKWS